MKKYLALLLTLCIGFSVALTGCSGGAKVKEIPDQSYAVVGNGGTAVQQGEYIYFVNGYNEIADEEGDTNVDNEVVRGGIYRAKLDVENGKTLTSTANADDYGDEDKFFADPYLGYYGTYKTFAPSSDKLPESNGDASDYSGFVMNTVKDYAEKELAQIKVEPIVNKKVSNGGNVGGGLFVLDGWIYFTTPDNHENREGVVQYERVCFMRAKLDGSNLQTLYTSKSTEVKPGFGYYRYNGVTYVVIHDVSDDTKTLDTLYSVACVGNKAGEAKVLQEDVKSALFPTKPVWYNGISENSTEDFVYYTYDVTSEDPVSTGNIMVRMRPDGSNGQKFHSGDTTVTLKKVLNGHLYYEEANHDKTTSIVSTDLAALPVDGVEEDRMVAKTTVYSDIAKLSNIFIGNEVVAVSGTTDKKVASVETYLIATLNGNTVKITDKDESALTLLQGVTAFVQTTFENHFVYQTAAAGATQVYMADIVTENQTPVTLTKHNATTDKFLPVDVAAGYLFYVSDVVDVISREDIANKTYKTIANYTLVRRLGVDSDIEWLMAEFAESDVPEAEKDEDGDGQPDKDPDEEEESSSEGQTDEPHNHE